VSRRSPRSQAVVERLLDERRRYQDWLQRLTVPGAAGASSPVVERVRADYQTRLDNVTRQLAQHEGELETVLAEAELRRDQATAQRTARQEALAEAVLRHEVGEYDQEKFASLSAEHASFVAQLTEDIEAATRDIDRVEEILALIARVLPVSPAAPPPSSSPPPPPAPDVPAGATSRADAEALGRVAAHIGGLDELSFLRSVAGGTRGGRAAPAPPPAEAPEEPLSPPAPPAAAPEVARPPRVSQPDVAAAAPAPRAPAPAEPPPVAAAPSGEAIGPAPGGGEAPASPSPAERAAEARRRDLPLPSPVEHIVPEVHEPKPPARAARRVSTTSSDLADDAARKTLKCLECSTLNLPTEWYCEKCGAELSAF
jgi:hypothetical protein